MLLPVGLQLMAKLLLVLAGGILLSCPTSSCSRLLMLLELLLLLGVQLSRLLPAPAMTGWWAARLLLLRLLLPLNLPVTSKPRLLLLQGLLPAPATPGWWIARLLSLGLQPITNLRLTSAVASPLSLLPSTSCSRLLVLAVMLLVPHG